MSADETTPEPSEDMRGAARRAGFDSIPLHNLLGLEFEAPPEGATEAMVTMPVRHEAFGSTGNLHGGAIATLVDVACAVAAARASRFDWERQSVVTADMHLRYLGRPRTDRVHARSKVVKVGRTLITVECKVVDDDGHVVATADFSSMIVPRRGSLAPDLEPDPGAPEL